MVSVILDYRETSVLAAKKAETYIASYFSRYPGVKQFMENSVVEARKKGFVTTLFGRRRFCLILTPQISAFVPLPSMLYEYPIQGTAADIIKKAMVDVYDRMINNFWLKRSRILLQVHDELLLEVVADDRNSQPDC